MDLLIKRLPNRYLLAAVSRKPTHSDWHLNFKSEHPMHYKQSVGNTVLERAKKTFSTVQVQDLNSKMKHVKGTLMLNGYPKWMLQDNKKQYKGFSVFISTLFYRTQLIWERSWNEFWINIVCRGVTRGEREAQFPGRQITMGAPIYCGALKSPNSVTSTFFNTVHLVPKDLRFKHGGAKFASCFGRHLTSFHSWSQANYLETYI